MTLMNEHTPAMTREQAIEQVTGPGQPYELEYVEMNGRQCRAFKNAPPTLRELYEHNRSDKPFLVYEDETWTFDEAYRYASQIATLLVERYGIRKGDRVAISMRNFPEWIMTFQAITSIGAIAVAMNALWQPEETEYGLNDSGARVLFADQERVDRVRNFYHDHPVQVIVVRATQPLPGNIPQLPDLLSAMGDVPMPPASIEPNDDATILYTSGSTGHPKGAVSNHRNIINALLSWEADGQIAELKSNLTPPEPTYQPAALLAIPLFHVTGLLAVALASHRAQRKVVCMYKWDADKAAELIERKKISSVVGPSAVTGDLIEAAKRSDRDLSSLAVVGGGGAPRAPEQVKKIASSFGKAMPNTGWGMTETNAIGTGIGGPDYLEHPDSSGRCSVVLDIGIFDEQGIQLPVGQRGELRVRGTSVIRGYWNRPDANAETFVDGWLRTGDVAYVDEEGFLYIVDRIKDLVIRGGENIGCGEVEAALYEHPAVLEASVYGVPDERLGEEVGASIYSRDPVDEDELRAFLTSRLARFEIPRYFRFHSEPLPRIATGKIDKRQLRDQAATA